MGKKDIQKALQKREYHTVNIKDAAMRKYTGNIPHHVIKIAEDEYSELGVVISKGFKNKELKDKLSPITNNKNWHLGEDKDLNPIALVESATLNELENDKIKPLSQESKASATLIRLYPASSIETQPNNSFSNQTLDNIEKEIRQHINVKNPIFNPETGFYEKVIVDLKPIGYYKPYKIFDLKAEDLNDIIINNKNNDNINY